MVAAFVREHVKRGADTNARQNGAELVLPVMQQQLAEGIGSAREVVAHVLRGLRDERLVERGVRGVVLLDPVRLQSELAPAS
jgi:hypothetical protein